MPPNQHGSAKPQPETTEFHQVLFIAQNEPAEAEQEGNPDHAASPCELWKAARAPATRVTSRLPAQAGHRPEVTSLLQPRGSSFYAVKEILIKSPNASTLGSLSYKKGWWCLITRRNTTQIHHEGKSARSLLPVSALESGDMFVFNSFFLY